MSNRTRVTMSMPGLQILSFLLVFGTLASASANVTVLAEFEGGNVIVERIDGDHIHIRPDLRDTKGNWFYWNFRVNEAAGRTLTFHFPRSGLISAHGPAVSRDGGTKWVWLGRESGTDRAFQYTFGKNENEVQFCVSIPYTQQHLNRFLTRLKHNKHLRIETLCQSKQNHRVLRLHAGKLDDEPDFRILLTCRHHACEMIASYALEGLVDAILSDTEDGEWFRNHVECLVIPVMDFDGVLNGDQGKNRMPRDHNRDYADESIHPEVRALRQLIPEWSAGKLRFALDMHCPGLVGGQSNETVYLVEANSPVVENTLPFAKILESVHTMGLPYKASETLRYGQGWNTDKNYTAGMSFAHWAGMQPGVRFSSTIEIPYANVNGTAVSKPLARQLGADIASSIRVFLTEY